MPGLSDGSSSQPQSQVPFVPAATRALLQLARQSRRSAPQAAALSAAQTSAAAMSDAGEPPAAPLADAVALPAAPMPASAVAKQNLCNFPTWDSQSVPKPPPPPPRPTLPSAPPPPARATEASFTPVDADAPLTPFSVEFRQQIMALPSCRMSAAGILLQSAPTVPKQGASAPPAAPVPAPSSVQPAPTVPNGLKQVANLAWCTSLAAPEQARSSVAAPDQAPTSAQPAPAVQKPAVPPAPTVAKPAVNVRPQDACARPAAPEPAPKLVLVHFAQPKLPVPKHVATAHLAAPMPALSSAQLAAVATVMPPPTSRETSCRTCLCR